MRISDWSSDVCSSDLLFRPMGNGRPAVLHLLVPQIADMGGQFGILVADGVQLLVIVPLDLGPAGGRAGPCGPWAPPRRRRPPRQDRPLPPRFMGGRPADGQYHTSVP